jgi:hypothetical protein
MTKPSVDEAHDAGSDTRPGFEDLSHNRLRTHPESQELLGDIRASGFVEHSEQPVESRRGTTAAGRMPWG